MALYRGLAQHRAYFSVADTSSFASMLRFSNLAALVRKNWRRLATATNPSVCPTSNPNCAAMIKTQP
jgi:hypothetical protein